MRSLGVMLLFAAVGVLVFYLTALAVSDWRPAWEHDGLRGVIRWTYKSASVTTVIVLFVLAFACAWMPFNRLLAAISLVLFYPAYSLAQILLGTYVGNLLPFEYLGYLFFILVCLAGYILGRWLSKHNTHAEKVSGN